MNILVIGGSYFFGRTFVIEAKKAEHSITILNRGKYPMHMDGICEVRGDRHEIDTYVGLKNGMFDAVVDFCAYQEGDIELVFRELAENIRHYVFVSTVDVYQRQIEKIKSEDMPFEVREIPGEAGSYIRGKVLLEKELLWCSKKWQIPWTSVRPAMLYGPYNYAPRESFYAKCMAEGKPMYYPVDAEGQFQFVYVKDAAKMLLALRGNVEAYCEAYNLCNTEPVDYSFVFSLLKELELPGTFIQEGRIQDAADRYFPFPLTKEETELYDGRKILSVTGESYSDLKEQMQQTIRCFYDIFSKGGRQ